MESESSTEQDTSSAGGVARAAADEASTAAGEVAGTAKDQARRVSEETMSRARDVGGTIRERVSGEADSLAQRATQGIRGWADELGAMAEGRTSQPGRFVGDIAARGRHAADYVEEHGLAGVVGQVESFARRRPLVFLLGAGATGFAVARLAKAAKEERQQPRHQPPQSDDRELTPALPADVGQAGTPLSTHAGR